jgi:hypothetical protein
MMYENKSIGSNVARQESLKAAPGKIQDEQLAKFENKCEMLEKMVDTMGLVMR